MFLSPWGRHIALSSFKHRLVFLYLFVRLFLWVRWENVMRNLRFVDWIKVAKVFYGKIWDLRIAELWFFSCFKLQFICRIKIYIHVKYRRKFPPKFEFFTVKISKCAQIFNSVHLVLPSIISLLYYVRHFIIIVVNGSSKNYEYVHSSCFISCSSSFWWTYIAAILFYL